MSPRCCFNSENSCTPAGSAAGTGYLAPAPAVLLIAYANAISEEDESLAIGHELLIPPGEGGRITISLNSPAQVAARALGEDRVLGVQLHAELEGMKLMPAFERLLAGWQAQRYALCSLRDFYSTLDRAALPLCEVVHSPISGRSGMLAVQGDEFLGGE